jgi:hypothetical protein
MKFVKVHNKTLDRETTVPESRVPHLLKERDSKASDWEVVKDAPADSKASKSTPANTRDKKES